MTNPAEWKVLIVDDDADSLRVTHDMLTLHGAEVACATDAREFRQLWRSFAPTLILMDLALPGTNGWELLAEIRPSLQVRPTPVVAVTAFHSQRVEREAEHAGFAAVIAKPLRSSTFIERLRAVMDNLGK